MATEFKGQSLLVYLISLHQGDRMSIINFYRKIEICITYETLYHVPSSCIWPYGSCGRRSSIYSAHTVHIRVFMMHQL